LLTSLLLLAAAAAQAKQRIDVIVALQKEFPGSISAFHSSGKYVLTYCPDNTCEKFQARKLSDASATADFLLLYLAYFSGYVVLEDWAPNEKTLQLIKDVIEKEPYAMCRRTTAAESARCILTNLNNRRVSVSFVRFDESSKSTSALDVRPALQSRIVPKRAVTLKRLLE
jgi:hypothetical protein